MPVPHTQSPVQMHRVRFVDYTPSPIAALAFAPLPLPPADKKGKGRQEKEELGPLVLARENGDVEIWHWAREEDGGVGNWHMDKVLPPTLTHPTISLISLVIKDPSNFGSKPYLVPKISDLRLFTAGSESTELVERCLETGRIIGITPIPSAPIWSMSVSPTHTLLCLSTTAPTLSFLSIPPSGPLEPPPPHLLRCESVPSRTRTVSIAWAPPKIIDVDGETVWADTYLITGNSDSSFRKWELPQPTESGRMGVRVSLKGRAVVEKVQKNGRGGRKNNGSQKGTIVWGVGVLPDDTIVTSDSLGNVTFWDALSLAQKQSFQAHKADGMCLVVGPSGRTVFTSGPDQRVCQFTRVSGNPGKSAWVQSGAKRIHAHDVRALAVFPPYTPLSPSLNPQLAPVLASGGWDMGVSFSPAATSDLLVNTVHNPLSKASGMSKVVFEEGFSRKMSTMGGGRGTGRISVSRKGRLVVVRRDRGVGIWRVLEEEQGWEKMLDMDFKLRTNLITSAVSDDGRWLAVSDLYETKVFTLHISPAGELVPSRVKTFVHTLHKSEKLADLSLETTGTGSTALLFTPDSQRLVMALTHAVVAIIGLPKDDDDDARVLECFNAVESDGGRVIARKRRRARKHDKQPNGDVEMAIEGDAGEAAAEEDEQPSDEPVQKTVTSGAWRVCLAASEDGQWLSTSDTLGRVAVYNLDTLRLHAVLPTLPTAPTAIAFPPAQPSLLAISSPSGSLQFYHLDNRRLLPPSYQLIELNSALKTQFTPVQSITFEPSRDHARASKLVIWSHDWLCSVQLDLDLIARLASKKMELGEPAPTPENGPKLSRSVRRKRAREAREALLESVSVSGSSDPSTPISGSINGSSGLDRGHAVRGSEFFKIQSDNYRGVCAVDWFESGEMVLVERPYGDYLGELPQAFWAGSFGKS